MSITERPESINNRLEFSHWEADTVVGQKTDKKCVFTLVERVTNFVIWMLVDKGSAGIIQALNEIFKHQPELAATIKSITYDNCSEFAKTKGMQFDATRQQKIWCLLCKRLPFNLWSETINQCSNKLIRLNIPKVC